MRVSHRAYDKSYTPFYFLICFSAGDDHTGGVKTLVLKQSKSFEQMQPKRPYIDRPLPSQPRLTYDFDPIQAQIQKEGSYFTRRRLMVVEGGRMDIYI